MPARQPADTSAPEVEIPTSRNSGEKWGIPFVIPSGCRRHVHSHYRADFAFSRVRLCMLGGYECASL